MLTYGPAAPRIQSKRVAYGDRIPDAIANGDAVHLHNRIAVIDGEGVSFDAVHPESDALKRMFSMSALAVATTTRTAVAENVRSRAARTRAVPIP